VEIVDTHASCCRDSLTTSPDGTQVFTYESEKIKVRLEGEVLIVNGREYTIPKRDDSIRIVDDRVEINGKRVNPDVTAPIVGE